VKSQKEPYWVGRIKAMRFRRASVADGVGGQPATKEKPKQRCCEVRNTSVPRLDSRSWKGGSGTTRIITHNLKRPFSDTCFKFHYVIVVCSWKCLRLRWLYCRPMPVQVRNVSASISMLRLTRKALHPPRRACESPASPRYNSCDDRHCSLLHRCQNQERACHLGTKYM
jgi:hypothetical protein